MHHAFVMNTLTYFFLVVSLSTINSQAPELQPFINQHLIIENGIAWAKVYECTETSVGNVPYESPFNDMAGFQTLAQYAISVRFEAANGGGADFQVQTVTCSNPIFNLNNGYEMSYVTNIATQLITGFADLNNWIGTDTAKARLTNNCYKAPAAFNGVPRTFTTSRLYHGCGSSIGIHLSIPGETTYGTCQWEGQATFNQPIAVYLGYDENLETWCSDITNSKYSYTPAPTSNPTLSPTELTQSPTKKPSSDPTKGPTNYPTADPTNDPTFDPTNYPTADPSNDPTFDPTVDPTYDPTIDPTSDPTTMPTTSMPTTAIPTPPTTEMPTTATPTTATPTTANPTTATPTTAISTPPTTAIPTAPTTANPTTPTTAEPTPRDVGTGSANMAYIKSVLILSFIVLLMS